MISQQLFIKHLIIQVGILAALQTAMPPFLAAKNERNAERSVSFQLLSPEMGMPAAAVFSILQDTRGFLWFGTYDGLVRYDGAEFRIYRHDPQDPHSLSNNRIRSLAEDVQGRIWVAMEGGGLCFWNRKSEQFSPFIFKIAVPYPKGLKNINSLIVDGSGMVWAGSFGSGLLRIDPISGETELFSQETAPPDGLKSNFVNALCRDRNGLIWIGTQSNLLTAFDPKTKSWKTYSLPPAKPRGADSGTVLALCEDRTGCLWAVSNTGLFHLGPARRNIERTPVDSEGRDAKKFLNVRALIADREGKLWIGTDGSGLISYDPDTRRFSEYHQNKYSPGSISSNVIRTIYQDRQGDLWVGAYPHSVNHVNRQNAAFRTYRSDPVSTQHLSEDSVTAFLEDPQGELWIGTDHGGLNHGNLSTEQWAAYHHNPGNPGSLGSDSVQALYRDSRGQLWVGAFNGGLNLLDPATGTFKRYLPRPDSANLEDYPVHVNAIAEDPRGRLWIATMGGLYRYIPSTGRFAPYRNDPKNPHSLNDNFATSLLSTRDGAFWVGTRNGLARWDSTSEGWIRFENQPGNKNSLSDNYVLDLLEDHRGSIWVATYDGGLNKLDPRKGEFQCLRASDGMPSNLIHGILEDSQGILWASTNNGIARINPETLQIRIYDESNGLLGRQFYPRARLRLRSGELLFGGSQGFSRINPAAVEMDQAPPPVVFTRFEVSNQPVYPALPNSLLPQSITETSRLEISSRVNVISFQFAALNFRSPTYNHYIYQLDGFDSVWRSAGLERRATYTNLAPGRYRLRVKAANRDKVWNETGASLELVILPTWQQSWWFQGSLALCLLGALAASVWKVALRRSREQLREAKREKQLAQERQQTAETLRESEYRYRQLVENTTDGISVVQDGFIRTLNARFALMIGYQLEEVIDQSLFLFIHPDDCAMLASHFHKRIQGDTEFPATHEFRLIRKEGEPLWFELNTTMIQWEGRPATLNIFRDTTDRKKAEEEKFKLERQLLQAQKLESLGVLAGGIAHDFNNVLGAIGGYTELVLQNEARPTEENREFLHQVLKASLRAKDLVKQILTFSRRGDQEFKPVRLDLLFKEALKFLRAAIPSTIGIEFVYEPTEFLAMADATQIHQIIMNLVTNSAYAMQEKGGKLAVKLSGMEFTSEWLHQSGRGMPAGKYARLTVHDEGPGIPLEILHKIFDPFFTTKPHGEGTGLGLSVVHGIVLNHQGAIQVTSTPGEGTVFELFLPLIEIAETAIGSECLPVHCRGQGEWILVVDDEADLVAMEKSMLEQLGYHVMAETNPRVALELFQGQSALYQALLTDHTMPNLTGLDLAAEVLKIRPEIPVILCTGGSDNLTEEKVRDQGVRGFLRKPFSLQELAETLGRLIKPI